MATRSPPSNQDISRTEIQAAIAKAAELRALHAALLQGSNHGKLKPHKSPSPAVSRHSPQLSAQDYPVFTPTYDEETVPVYHHIQLDPRRKSLNWEDGQEDEVESICTDKGSPLVAARRPSGLFSRGLAFSITEQSLSTNSSTHHAAGLLSSFGNSNLQLSRLSEIDGIDRKRTPNEAESSVSWNGCKPAALVRENTTVVPLTESQDSVELPRKEKTSNNLLKSWLFFRAKKKISKNNSSQNKAEPAVFYKSMEEWAMALESLKQKLMEANENRDTAVAEVTELRSSMDELEKKLRQLELYCKDLKDALNQTVQDGSVADSDKTGMRKYENATLYRKPDNGGKQNPLPVTTETMIEGFMQIVSEARVSVKHFCRTLVTQIQDLDGKAMEKLSLLLQPYNVSVTSKVKRSFLYHLESLINQALYQDFENCSFQKNGAQSILDIQEHCKENFSSYASLRNLSWNEVLNKGTRYYSESFSRFCDQKMSLIVSMLNWTKAWPEPLLQAFFIAAKCIWLVHLLAFSFNPSLTIFRVDKGTNFDPMYMEDIATESNKRQVPTKVRIMVMPGFYVHDRILICKVLCRYRIGA
ncbi:hypothetical protein SUGI_0406350 [Cryptomeria japonica]|nr:hypothetical protein SUGI_0406350 [Cryptomeria japonica]